MIIFNDTPETGTEMCARWDREREVADAEIEKRAEFLCHQNESLEWNQALLIAREGYYS